MLNIEIHIVIDNHKITTKWLVNAIPKGIKLSKLENKIKIKITKIKGVHAKPFIPACCFIILIIKR